MRDYFLGVDAGASKTKLRLETADGVLIDEHICGPASLRASHTHALQAVLTAAQSLFAAAAIESHQVHVGIGIAGSELVATYESFTKLPHPFKSLAATSDAEIACLGAHAGDDGAIVITGTGSVGFIKQLDRRKTIGGFGFPHDDLGSGSAIGLAAVRKTCQALDGRQAQSMLTKLVFAHLKNHRGAFMHWINEAKATEFASLFPVVLQAAQAACDDANLLLSDAAAEIERIGFTLIGDYNLPLSILGGIAPYLTPYYSDRFKLKITAAKFAPEKGAILFSKSKCSMYA